MAGKNTSGYVLTDHLEIKIPVRQRGGIHEVVHILRFPPTDPEWIAYQIATTKAAAFSRGVVQQIAMAEGDVSKIDMSKVLNKARPEALAKGVEIIAIALSKLWNALIVDVKGYHRDDGKPVTAADLDEYKHRIPYPHKDKAIGGLSDEMGIATVERKN